MKNKYFNDFNQWKESDIDTIGLPRPFAFTTRKDLAKRVPIPWQSEDRFLSKGNLGLNQKNEDMIYDNDLCPYCGIKILTEETTIRWINAPFKLTKKEGPKVFSDFHPFHLECMRQARIFCPHMRKLKNTDFKVGLYKDLKQDTIKDAIQSEEFKNEKNIKKDLQS